MGEVRTCGNVCATPVLTGNTCSQDDCTSISVCEDNGSCIPLGGLFVCALPPFGMTLLSDCSADPGACAHDLFCRDLDDCTGAPMYGQRCSVGVPQGYSCDSEWDSPDCKPCMPELDCIGATGNKKCRAKCDTSADCPCGDSAAENGCNPDDDHCYLCKGTGEACNEDNLCCDSGTICGPVSQVCCPAIGETCIGHSDCCDEHSCRTNGTCNVCIPDFESCSSSADCCSEVCVNGECREDCTAEAEAETPCQVDEEDGECGKGVVTCDDYVKNCVPLQEGPETEVCDDLDNDCDGKTDEDLKEYGSCPSAHHPPSCQAGFTTTGVLSCEEGEEVCNSTAGVDYCASCDDVLANSASCGWCSTNPATCSSHSQCAPGARCIYDAILMHNRCQDDINCTTDFYDCWTPSMNGTCP